MKEAAKEAVVGNKSEYNQIKSIAKIYVTSGKVLFRNASLYLMPELWLRRIFL